MRKLPTLLVALIAPIALPGAAPATPPAAPAAAGPPVADRLAVGFLSRAFLAEVADRVETQRTYDARLAGGTLQEKTGLLWARQDNGKDIDWYDAELYCRELEVADWTDWRLPTIEELEGLHDRRSNAPYKLTRDIALSACCPWSQSLNGETSAWNFSFRYRKPFSGSLNLSYELRALCVRRATEQDVEFLEQAAEDAAAAAKKRRS